MAVRLCNIPLITCPCADGLPSSNYSAESPDVLDYISLNFPPWQNYQVLGDDPQHRDGMGPVWFAEGCVQTCISLLSQEDANLCAARLSYLCNRGNRGLPAPPLFCNTAKSCTVTEADGTTLTYTVPACSFYASTQYLADLVASVYCQRQAQTRVIILSSIPASGCLSTIYTSNISVLLGAGAPFTFSVSGGSLPPGLTLAPVNGTTATLFGVPLVAGTYNFSIRAVNVNGTFIDRPYSITVLGITNMPPDIKVGSPYSFQFQASGGRASYNYALSPSSQPLPAGLSLSSTGLLSGTATSAGTATFTVQITDSSAPALTCFSKFTVNIKSAAKCPVRLADLAFAGVPMGGIGSALTNNVLHPRMILVGRTGDTLAIDRQTGVSFATIANAQGVGPGAEGVLYTSPQDNWYLACTNVGAIVQVVRASTMGQVASISNANANPFGWLVYDATNDRVYCGQAGAASGTNLIVINPNTNAIVNTIAVTAAVGDTVQGVVYVASANQIWFCVAPAAGNPFIKVINAVTFTTAYTINLPQPSIVGGPAFDPVENKVYVPTRSGGGTNFLEARNAATGALIASITLTDFIGTNVRYAATEGLICYMKSSPALTIEFVDPSKDTILCALADGGGGLDHAVDDLGRIFVVNGAGTLSLYDPG